MITAEQFQEWKTHPVTQEILRELESIKKNIVEQIANGNTIGPDAQATHGFTNRAIGQIDGLNQLLNISFSDSGVDNEVDERSGY